LIWRRVARAKSWVAPAKVRVAIAMPQSRALAAERGHSAVVRLLLGADPRIPGNSTDSYGRTPLLRAAKNGHRPVVKLLLGRKDINPWCADSDGKTAYMWTEEEGHDAVRILLDQATRAKSPRTVATSRSLSHKSSSSATLTIG
jgi:hypothetical protein